MQNKLANEEELYNIYLKVSNNNYRLKNPNLEVYLSGNFVPSKTGKNGLNFVRSEDESNLATKEQHDEIIEFFKVIYILFKISYEDIAKNDIIPHLRNVLFGKYNVDSFSKCFVINF